ncbi:MULTISPECIES: glycosyltransferase [Bacillus cereus group]|uniref:glycosyltransferase n=1 Tax=Bacillus cereus group TaxID=86661 RepID=UPI0008FE48FF|nr:MULTISPECIES: glycosyltransferase [Bacillus cereus group]MDG1621869.1 glycosyltransferase [Bacillus mobilis]MDX5839694.1 glycosyltransferase [Bacillus cereus group sp. BfR-BA-01700]MED4385816.1 glycosyltransferase [Bacillus mobilis]OJE45296.1 glycosyl transferase [Bacillus mobilis]HDR7242801.1 glycosyltransferase [Bacillus mobilis]
MKKKKILITSFDMAIGGVERSLIGLLNTIDYSKYDVDLMLFKHEGEFLFLLPKLPNLLKEVKQYTTFRKSIKQILQEGQITIGMARTLGKILGDVHGRYVKSAEVGYFVIQYGWRITLPFIPKLEEEYDVAISFLWPHYFVGDKVRAKRKIGWIHTDYSNINLNANMEYKMWGKMDNIVAVSEGCRDSFLSILPNVNKNVEIIENILSPEFVREQANREDVMKELQMKPGKIKLVTVGRLSYAKGIDVAMHALRKLLDEGYDMEWYVVGYGALEAELRKLLAELKLEKHFFLLGKKTNPYPYIKACDIYVQPSRYEGKAVTVREAQIIGKPVLITNFSTAKSQVQDGIDGLITEMGINGIVNGIKRLIEDKELREVLVENTLKGEYGNRNEINKLYALFS